MGFKRPFTFVVVFTFMGEFAFKVAIELFILEFTVPQLMEMAYFCFEAFETFTFAITKMVVKSKIIFIFPLI